MFGWNQLSVSKDWPQQVCTKTQWTAQSCLLDLNTSLTAHQCAENTLIENTISGEKKKDRLALHDRIKYSFKDTRHQLQKQAWKLSYKKKKKKEKKAEATEKSGVGIGQRFSFRWENQGICGRNFRSAHFQIECSIHSHIFMAKHFFIC